MINSRVASSPSSSQRPRASANATSGMPSILDAALGLTNLGAPSPPNSKQSSPSPNGGASNTPSFKEASDARPVAQDMHKPMFMDSSILKAAPALKPSLKQPMTTLNIPPTRHYRENIPSYPVAATVPGTALPPLDYSSPWSSMIHPHPSATGFESFRFSDPAMAMDRFSVNERITMMDRATALTNVGPANLGYPYRYPPPSYPQKSVASSCFQSILNPYENPGPTFTKNFPELLFDIISAEENADMISWLPHGRGFSINDKQRFSDIILKRYFDGAKFTSFTRRLKRWDFVRVPRGPELGAYYNERFVRDRPDLVQKMRYQMEGSKFEKQKKKNSGSGEDKNDGDEKMEDQIENEVEAKAAERSPKKEQDPVNEPPRPRSQSPECEGLANRQPNPQTKINPKIQKDSTDPQERPMPLPSALPKSPEKTVSGTHPLKMNLATEVRGDPSEGRAAATLVHGLSPMRTHHHPNMMPLKNDKESQLIEMQRELLLARSHLAREIASGGSTRSATLGPAANNSSRLTGSNTMPGYPHCPHPATSTTSPRMTNVERSELTDPMIGTERFLGHPSSHHGQFANSKNGADRELASKVIASSNRHNDMMNAAILLEDQLRGHAAMPGSYEKGRQPNIATRMGELEFDSKGAASPVRSNSGGGGARAIMMTREEEEGFARYMYMKRSSGVSAA